jgi:hypothetical protein
MPKRLWRGKMQRRLACGKKFEYALRAILGKSARIQCDEIKFQVYDLNHEHLHRTYRQVN